MCSAIFVGANLFDLFLLPLMKTAEQAFQSLALYKVYFTRLGDIRTCYWAPLKRPHSFRNGNL